MSRHQCLRSLAVAVLAALALTIAMAASGMRDLASKERPAPDLGAAVVIDGDTLQIGDETVELFGIDAPELGQLCKHDGSWETCGFDAAFELHKILGMHSEAIRCRVAPATANQPPRSVCLIGSLDLAHALIVSGYAVAAQNSGPYYEQAEKAAQSARLGLWHDKFVQPSHWRAGQRLPGEDAAEMDKCPIKGVIVSEGRKAYFVPTDPGYADLQVDESAGGRRFCSDEEARAAGWTRMPVSQNQS